MPQLEYKAPAVVCKTDEQAISAAALIARLYSGLDLEKWLKGRKCLLKPSRKDIISRQDTLAGPTNGVSLAN